MTYRVLVAERFRVQLEAQLSYFEREFVPIARIAKWLNDLLALMDSLEDLPLRFPVAQTESQIEGIQLRRVVFGDYLIFYRVDEDSAEVQVYGFRHGARLP